MRYCKPCFLRSRIRHVAGKLGLCAKHEKTRCQICHALSAGELYCVTCERKSDILRMRKEANPLYRGEEDRFISYELRREKLLQSRYHAYRAIDIKYHAYLLLLQALHGGIADPKAQPEEHNNTENGEDFFKKAA